VIRVEKPSLEELWSRGLTAFSAGRILLRIPQAIDEDVVRGRAASGLVSRQFFGRRTA
jgi:hypothetical protein